MKCKTSSVASRKWRRDVTQGISIEQNALDQAHQHWVRLREYIQKYYLDSYAASAVPPFIDEIDSSFAAADKAQAMYQNAQHAAEEARRPLDAKKLLDMLIDEIEDKYIELLEGIRSHTANIDGYVKGIATALDDDFNNQFYYPAFKEIRKSSSYWDVQLGQVETTNILTNNRMFAKVEPQATMEFDLPKRDILINEAMNGAKALMDSYGAGRRPQLPGGTKCRAASRPARLPRGSAQAATPCETSCPASPDPTTNSSSPRPPPAAKIRLAARSPHPGSGDLQI